MHKYNKSKMKKKYFKQFKKFFSLKNISILFIPAVIADIIFYFLVLVILSFTMNQLNTLQSLFNQLEIEKIQQGGMHLLDKTTSIISGIKTELLMITIVFIILYALVYTICKGISWSCLLEKKPSLKYFLKFFLLNLIWFALFMLIIVLAALFTIPEIAILIILILTFLIMYLSWILAAIFTLKNQIKASIKKTLKTGILKIHYFLIPLLIILIIMILANIIIKPYIHHFIYMAIIITFITYMRLSMSKIIIFIKPK